MKRPNLLLIVADQQRFDSLGYTGRLPVSTPHIDSIAEQGTWFRNCYTSIPTCCPARQSLLSGVSAESLGAHWNYDITMPIPSLTPDTSTWSKTMADNGYNSAFVGKWHVSPTYDPRSFGYRYFYGVNDYDLYYREICPGCLFENGLLGERDPVSVEQSRTHLFANEAVEQIRELSTLDAPWHVRLDFPEPHPPYRPVAPFAGMYAADQIPAWGSFAETFQNKPYIQRQQLSNWGISEMTWEEWAPTVAHYFAIISQYDDAVGRVLSALDELGLRENTIVVYTSDHGDMTGSHRMIDKHYVMYDDVVRVPLAVSGPGIAKQTREEFVCNTLDLAPTILDALGLKMYGGLHGRSLMPLLSGEGAPEWPREAVSTYNGSQFGLYCQRMIRTREWKYIWNLTDIDELYDLRSDPFELTNRIGNADTYEIRKDLKRRLYERLKERNDPLLRGPWLEPQLLEHGSLVKREIPPTP